VLGVGVLVAIGFGVLGVGVLVAIGFGVLGVGVLVAIGLGVLGAPVLVGIIVLGISVIENGPISSSSVDVVLGVGVSVAVLGVIGGLPGV
jgi:hypothetical protein